MDRRPTSGRPKAVSRRYGDAELFLDDGSSPPSRAIPGPDIFVAADTRHDLTGPNAAAAPRADSMTR